MLCPRTAQSFDVTAYVFSTLSDLPEAEENTPVSSVSNGSTMWKVHVNPNRKPVLSQLVHELNNKWAAMNQKAEGKENTGRSLLSRRCVSRIHTLKKPTVTQVCQVSMSV